MSPEYQSPRLLEHEPCIVIDDLRWFTHQQMCRMIEISEATLYRWVKKGAVICKDVDGISLYRQYSATTEMYAPDDVTKHFKKYDIKMDRFDVSKYDFDTANSSSGVSKKFTENTSSLG